MRSSDSVLAPIPYFRCRSHIRRAVEGLLEQSYENLHVLVMNDGDSSPPWDVLADIHDSRIWRLDIPMNRGMYFAVELALRSTEAPYLLVQDADDWSHPHRVEDLLHALHERPADAALSDQLRFDETRALGPALDCFADRIGKPITCSIAYRGLHHGLYRASLLRDVGGYYAGVRVGYDTVLVNLVAMYSAIAYVEKPLYYRHIRKDSLTASIRTGIGSPYREQALEKLEDVYVECYIAYRQFQARAISKREFSHRLKRAVARHVTSRHEAELRTLSARVRPLLLGPTVDVIHL